MDENMECPICKKKVVFVGVHDDEGNYHGPVGCEYENDPWSGLSYALHHEGWGDCLLCTDGAYSTMGGMLFDTAEDAISALSTPNEPLTLAQLREMVDEPAYLYMYDTALDSGWHIIKAVTEDKIIFRGWNTVYVPVSSLGRCFDLYAYPPAHIDREAWTAEWLEYTGADAGFHYCSKCGQQAFNYENGGEVVEVLSEFCPSCGKAMTPEAWAELEKRMGVRV